METLLLSILTASGLLTVSSYLSNQYHFVYDQMNWTEAQRYCREKFTDLATIDNMEDVKRLNDMVDLNKLTDNRTWIGLYDDLNSWRWSLEDKRFYKDGEAEFRNWGTGEPNNVYGIEHCSEMYHSGVWNDDSCTESLFAICLDARGLNETFLLTNKTLTWTEAQSYCRETHTDLASVRNQSENEEIRQLIPSGQSAWIGLFRDSWKWSDGSNSTFRNWNKGIEPNNRHPKETCAAAVLSSPTGYWEDWNCDVRRAFICYDSAFKKQVVRVKLSKNDASLDLNDPAVLEDILKQFKQRLKEQTGTEDIHISWRQQPDGKVFHKEEKKMKGKRKPTMTKGEL